MNATERAAIEGMRVLLVEDSFLVASAMRRMVEELGCTVVGPAPDVERALELLESERCDAAILDINLGGETVQPVADRLAEMRTPFLFVTGYLSPELLEQCHRARRRLHKPVPYTVLRSAMEAEFLAQN